MILNDTKIKMIDGNKKIDNINIDDKTINGKVTGIIKLINTYFI